MTASETKISTARRYRFGVFEVDFAGRDLKKHGIRVKLQLKPLQILELLIERRGELVTRAELARHLWPGLHVSFDRSLNTAVNILRQALGESSQNPRFIETRSGLGYRFIAPVEIVQPVAAVRAAAPDAVSSIVVLPFENHAGDPALNYLADGIAETLIGALSRVAGVRVIARTTAFRFRAPDLDVQDVGRRLHVGAVVTGRIEARGIALSIAFELVDVESGSRMGGNEYERMPNEIATLTKDIASEVLRTLRPSIDRKVETRIRQGYSRDFEAYQDYLKGRFFQHKRSEEDLRRSVAHFEASLARDPNYALAYAGLADTYNLFAFMGILPPGEAHPRALQNVTAALRIDPDLAEAHAALASVKKLYDWDWQGAEDEYLTALRLNPNYAPARQSFAAFLSAIGRGEEALRHIRLAQELDPLSLVINVELAWILYMQRDHRAAMEQSWQTLTMEPRFAAAQQTLGLAYEQMGLHEDAIVEFQNARVCSDGHPASLAGLGHAYATAGQPGEAEAILGELGQMSRERYVSPYWLSIVYAGLGEDDRVFECLREGLDSRDVWMVWLKVEPRFDRLRSEARFDALLRSMALE